MEQYPTRPKSLNDELNESQIDIEVSLARILGNEAQICEIELYQDIDWERLWQASGDLAMLEHPSEMLESDTSQVVTFRAMLFALQTISIAGRGRHNLMKVSQTAAQRITDQPDQVVDTAWTYLAKNTSISTHISNYVTQINPDGVEFGSAEAAYATICIAADDAIARADKVI